MALRISRVFHGALLAEAMANPEREVCGLLLGTEAVVRIVPARNVAMTPDTAFEIDPSVLFSAIREERDGGPKILGYYHSHPTGDANPSRADQAQAVADGKLWAIIANGAIAAWRLSATGVFEQVAVEITN
jgi:desampylase